MQMIQNKIKELGYRAIEGGRVVVEATSGELNTPYYIAGGVATQIEVEPNTKAQFIAINNASTQIEFLIADGASIEVVELFESASDSKLIIEMAAATTCKIVSIQTESSTSSIGITLRGAGAHAQIDTLQLNSSSDKCSLDLRMEHQSADCTSRSLSKCVASGDSTISFDGLVYVAQGAQRTIADQNCRTIQLSDSAHLIAQPQLEIYADDVKCTHGATVGQIDSDAILYMRQRGLSESQARRLQMEGFAADIVDRCPIADICEYIMEQVDDKLHTL